jgi:DHA1 family bicyclomycin/chloramphenicol resistance-like MFS transporter
MRIRPDTFAMTALLASNAALGPFSTDTYMASLPFIGVELAASTDRVQLTLSAYLIGFSLGQVIYGPVADKYGRKPVMIFGLGLYVLASFLCAIAQSIEVLILARTLQAFAGAAPIILARAIVRDIYEGVRAARELSVMTSIGGLAPIVAPILGGVLQVAFGWRSVFVAMTLIGLILFINAAFLLPETIRQKQAAPLSVRGILKSFAIVGRNPAFRAYAGMQAMTYTGLFCFISTSSFILQRLYGFSPVAFSLAFATCSLSFLGATFVNRRLVPRLGLNGTIGVGVACLAVGGVLQVIGVVFWPASIVAFIAPTMIFFAGMGLNLPLSIAGALAPFPERAGAASSLMGLCQMTLAAIVGAFISRLLDTSALPFAIAMAVVGLSALTIFVTTRRVRRDPAR